MISRFRIILLALVAICFIAGTLLWRDNSWVPLSPEAVPSEKKLVAGKPASLKETEQNLADSKKSDGAAKRRLSKPISWINKENDSRFHTIFHNNGQLTETRKMGNSNQVRQDTYGKDGNLLEVRTFDMDGQGRLRNGVIYNGRKKPVASTRYTYNPGTNQLLVEEIFNTRGKRVRILYYPGALKNPKFADRMVAFSFDPNKPKAKKVEIKGPVNPIMPIVRGDEAVEFENSRDAK